MYVHCYVVFHLIGHMAEKIRVINLYSEFATSLKVEQLNMTVEYIQDKLHNSSKA